MHSFIIIANNKTDIEKKRQEILARFNIKPFNITYIIESANIKAVRDAIKKINATAQKQEFQAFIISNIGLLREDAQQTLLKTIEEPPINTICIIEGSFADFILPTILSRSQIINISGDSSRVGDLKEFANFWKPLLTINSISGKLSAATKIIQENKEKELLLQWLDSQMLFFRSLMYKRAGIPKTEKLGSGKIARIIASFIAAKRYISLNINSKLVIDNLFLSLTKSG